MGNSCGPRGRSPDASTVVLAVIIVGISLWILAMPLSTTVQSATLARFHLATDSFGRWALQQPIPAMYSFENRYWMFDSTAEPGDLWEQQTCAETKVVNHFPLRMLTFADNRYRFLKEGRPCNLIVRSRYRGNEWLTLCRARVSPRGGFELTRAPIPPAQIPPAPIPPGREGS